MIQSLHSAIYYKTFLTIYFLFPLSRGLLGVTKLLQDLSRTPKRPHDRGNLNIILKDPRPYVTLQKKEVWAQLNALEKRFKICHVFGIRKPI